MTSFEDLLTVQEHDTAIDRLRAQREKLSERSELVDREAELSELTGQLDELRGSRDEVARDEKRLDDNVAAIGERQAEVEATMYSGKISNPKELQAMQAEVEQFRRQQRTLEDQELDLMERRETIEGEISQLEEKLRAAQADVDRLRESLHAKETEIDAQLAAEREARENAANGLPGDLLELYEKIRAKNNGIGAARLVGGTCQGCHLALPAVEVDRIKKEPADELVRCDQCGSILVR